MPLDAENLLPLLRRLTRSAARATRASGRVPAVPRARVDVLRALANLGPSTPTALADHLNLAKPTVSNLLRSLTGTGLVARAPSTTDGRVQLVSITPAATAILDAWRSEQRALFTQAYAALSADERKILHAARPALTALADELDRLAEQAENDRASREQQE